MIQYQDNQTIALYKINLTCIFRHLFAWQLLLFLIYNYYLLEVVMSSSFYDMYLSTQTTLMPMNIIFFILMAIDLLVKIAAIKNKDDQNQKERGSLSQIIWYYLFKKLVALDVLFLSTFIASYIVQYQIARWIRYVIVLKIFEVVDFNSKIYQKIHTYEVLRKLYTIFKISYVMLLFSHYFGTWFYLMDQVLLDEQYYGPPAQANQLYYQMNMLCYTPIEALDNWGRYLYGLYFMVSLITTIAYGDIVGKNPYEQIYVSVLMVLSTISLGLILEQFMDFVRFDSYGMYDFIKNYNSLKTFMDDSSISYLVQNRVRSYLVYTQYEKKSHAHEEITQKLTEKLQMELKTESYSQAIQLWIVPYMPQFADNVKQLCNICKLVSFQAQTDIYEELETVETASQCGYLYKISGDVEEYLELESSRLSLPKSQKKHYNLSRFYTNFNLEIAYDSDEESELEFSIGEQQQEEQVKAYSLISVSKRKLRSIKISQFVLLEAEQFYEFVNKRKMWFKRIKQLKQEIISQDIDPYLLGENCTVCKDKAMDHSIENCPSLHLSYNQRIKGSFQLKQLMNRSQERTNWFEQGKSKRNSLRESRKVRRFIGRLGNKGKHGVDSDGSKNQTSEQKFISIFKHMLANFTDVQEDYEGLSDCVYDPKGLNSNFSLDYPTESLVQP